MAAATAAAGSVAAGLSATLAYSREDEIQADQIGLTYLTKAGYDGSAMLRILGKVRQKTWFGEDQIPSYLSTHPALSERIAYIDTHLASPSLQTPVLWPQRSYDFTRVHTRVLAMYGDETNILALMQANVARNPKNPMAHYGYGVDSRPGRQAP